MLSTEHAELVATHELGQAAVYGDWYEGSVRILKLIVGQRLNPFRDPNSDKPHIANASTHVDDIRTFQLSGSTSEADFIAMLRRIKKTIPWEDGNIIVEKPERVITRPPTRAGQGVGTRKSTLASSSDAKDAGNIAGVGNRKTLEPVVVNKVTSIKELGEDNTVGEKIDKLTDAVGETNTKIEQLTDVLLQNAEKPKPKPKTKQNKKTQKKDEPEQGSVPDELTPPK